MELEGLDNNKFNLTIKNLRFANESIKYFVKNLKTIQQIQILTSLLFWIKFFSSARGSSFSLFTEVLKSVGKYYQLEEKIDKLIYQIKNNNSLWPL